MGTVFCGTLYVPAGFFVPLIPTTVGLEGSDKGLLIVDENEMTTREGVFAAGDVVHGSKTVVHAVEQAKKAAAAMIAYIEK